MQKLKIASGLCVGLVLVACGDAEGTEEASSPESVTWTWNVSETGEQDSPFGQTAEYFASELEARTDGAITVDLHFGGGLGYEAGEMLEAVGEGFVDGGDLSLPHVSGSEPLTNFGAMPMLHAGYEEHWDWLDNLFIPEMDDRFQEEWNVVPIGSYTFGQMYLLWDQALDGTPQLEGERFRVMNDVHGEFFSQVGVSPIYLGVEELATAMERGMMDGMPNSNPIVMQLDAWDYYDYRNDLQAITGSSLYSVNRDAFEALSEDLQQTVLEVGQDATEYGRELLEEDDAETAEVLADQGMTTHEVPEDTLSEIREAGETAWRNWAEGVGDEAVDLLDKTIDFSQ